MIDVLIIIFATLGALFILIAAVGLVRMPDFYLRQSVTVKAATLGAGLIVLAVSLYFHQLSVFTKAVAVVFFLFVTAPVSGHMICRSAYISGNKLWKDSVLDELKGKYDREKDVLHGTNARLNPGGNSAVNADPAADAAGGPVEDPDASGGPDPDVPGGPDPDLPGGPDPHLPGAGGAAEDPHTPEGPGKGPQEA